MTRSIETLCALALSVLLAACAVNGLTYYGSPAAIEALPGDKARVVFFRTTESTRNILGKARIAIDGTKVGAIAAGDFGYYDFEPGKHRLRTDLWDTPGHCELTVEAAAREVYYFKVDARTADFGAFARRGFVASHVSDGTADAWSRDCAGEFRLYPVDSQTAQNELAVLVDSN